MCVCVFVCVSTCINFYGCLVEISNRRFDARVTSGGEGLRCGRPGRVCMFWYACIYLWIRVWLLGVVKQTSRARSSLRRDNLRSWMCAFSCVCFCARACIYGVCVCVCMFADL